MKPTFQRDRVLLSWQETALKKALVKQHKMSSTYINIILPSLAIGTTLLFLIDRIRNSKISTTTSTLTQLPSKPTTSYQTTLTRLMLPDDANPAGNVHGGTILKLMEMSAYILANRHGNKNITSNTTPTTAILASFSSATFLKPMHVGDISHVKSKILATYSSSMLISVHVYREDIRNGNSTLIKTNEANLWYVRVRSNVALSKSQFRMERKFSICSGLLQITPISAIDIKICQIQRKYAIDQRKRTNRTHTSTNIYNPLLDPTDVIIARITRPSDGTQSGLVFGGVLAKEMDSAAGVATYKLCYTNCVTVSMNNLVLLSPCMVGDYIKVRVRIIFVSSKTAELEAIVTRDDDSIDRGVERVCARAR